MKEELREILVEKTLKLLEAREEFDEGRITFMNFLETIKQLTEEIQGILNKAEFMNKH